MYKLLPQINFDPGKPDEVERSSTVDDELLEKKGNPYEKQHKRTIFCHLALSVVIATLAWTMGFYLGASRVHRRCAPQYLEDVAAQSELLKRFPIPS